VRFEQRLEGFERGLFPAGTDRAAHYSGLGHGSYRFMVRAANEDGVWAEDMVSLGFSVRPYFWQTLWFYALCAAALVVALGATIELRTRALRLREQELRRSVTEQMSQVKVLRGLLPTCAWCKKVRDDAGYWSEIEAYIAKHTEAEFSHGICPDCRARFRSGELK
jgi:hypothetical protein